MNGMTHRCNWAKNELSIHYHDTEWGVPLHDDQKLFELLTLEGAQAGLSWDTVLAKRDNYRKAFDNFDVQKIANYDTTKYAELLENPGIIRNHLKIASTIKNAQSFLVIQKEFGSFDTYLWGFVDGTPIISHWNSVADIPASNEPSTHISKDLKRRGFSFVGTTIIYSYLQSAGLINDHIVSCFRHSNLCTDHVAK